MSTTISETLKPMAEDQLFASTLPFSQDLQSAALGWMLLDTSFFNQARLTVKPAWFLDPWNSKLWQAALSFHKTFTRPPNIEELKAHTDLRIMEQAERSRCYTQLRVCTERKLCYGLDVVQSQLSEWMKTRVYAESVKQGMRAFNSKKLDDAYQLALDLPKQLKECDFEGQKEVRWEDYQQVFTEQDTEYDDALTFGVGTFDSLLTPKAKKGSLLRGDTTVLMAPTNVGKTSTMVNVAVANVKRCKPVLLVTHEGRTNDIFEKIWCCAMKVTPAQRRLLQESEDGRRLMESTLLYLKRYLTFIPYCKANGTVDEVEVLIRKKQEERMSRSHDGKGFALVIDDYPAKLVTSGYRGGTQSRRDRDEYIYNVFVQLALEYGFHSLLAIQTNREGSRVNAGEYDDRHGDHRLLRMEDVLESWGPMTCATNVISINRDPRATAANRVTFYICKSRSSEVGWAVVCRSDFSRCITHSDELGSTYYRGTAAMADRIEALLNDPQYQGLCIPDEMLR